jgi:hypothetical protein
MKSLCRYLLILLIFLPGLAQERPSNKSKRLILKDGSYESVREYQILDDRVRYFSMERREWEEMPSSLVDWDATGKLAGTSSQEALERKNEALNQAAKDRSEEESRAPVLMPGIQLPASGGVYLLDTFQSQPVLSRLAQNGADLQKNLGSNILRGVINPIAGSKQTIELKGPHALIQSHVPSPAFYLSVDPGDQEAGYDSRTAQDHLKLVRCRDKKGNRIVLTIEIAIYGKVKVRADYVDVVVEPVTDYWVKITPKLVLNKGEYAIVEFDAKGSANQYVWDFGMNPDAPANPASVSPEPEKSEPVLIQKPRKTNQ